MMRSLGTKLVEVCRCLFAGPLLVLLILTIRRAEPICINDFWGPGIIVKQFRQAMGVTVIILVKLFRLMKKSWLLEQPVGIMAKQCMHLH